MLKRFGVVVVSLALTLVILGCLLWLANSGGDNTPPSWSLCSCISIDKSVVLLFLPLILLFFFVSSVFGCSGGNIGNCWSSCSSIPYGIATLPFIFVYLVKPWFSLKLRSIGWFSSLLSFTFTLTFEFALEFDFGEIISSTASVLPTCDTFCDLLWVAVVAAACGSKNAFSETIELPIPIPIPIPLLAHVPIPIPPLWFILAPGPINPDPLDTILNGL